MQHDAADELHAEGPHAQHTRTRLAHGGKRLRQQIVQRLAALIARLEFCSFAAQLLVGQCGVFIAQRLDFVHERKEFFYFPLAAGAEQFIDNAHGFAFPASPLDGGDSYTYFIISYSLSKKKRNFVLFVFELRRELLYTSV